MSLRVDEIHRIRQELLGLVVGAQKTLWSISKESGIEKALLQKFLDGEEITSERALNIHAYLYERNKAAVNAQKLREDPHVNLPYQERFRFLHAVMKTLHLKPWISEHEWYMRDGKTQALMLHRMDQQCKKQFMKIHAEEIGRRHMRFPDGMSFRQWWAKWKRRDASL